MLIVASSRNDSTIYLPDIKFDNVIAIQIHLYIQYFCIIVPTLKNSHQTVYLLTLESSSELLAMPNSRLTYQNLR